MIKTFVGQDALVATKSDSPGLYIVRSVVEPTYYRVGESGNLGNRSKQHSGKSGLVGFADPNFCEMYREWSAVWIGFAPNRSRYARLICENILTGAVGQRFKMIAGSSFIVPAESADLMIALAEGLRSTFTDVFALQTMPVFDKRAHRAERLAQTASS